MRRQRKYFNELEDRDRLNSLDRLFPDSAHFAHSYAGQTSPIITGFFSLLLLTWAHFLFISSSPRCPLIFVLATTAWLLGSASFAQCLVELDSSEPSANGVASAGEAELSERDLMEQCDPCGLAELSTKRSQFLRLGKWGTFVRLGKRSQFLRIGR
ncbi:unnamed protein product [Protopolystoma xenopodis]|uniref:Uncharacterized protein n=1 Tax=Protopolystoma xenopodis TaxID=117903 RepID=A0A448XCW0_9PLAT|nr:unnamed protein product [Protopolystoma xenopodis]